MLLSIGMMIKNEEKHLRECLQCLMPLLNNIESELIIIDTGSTDDSVNIAKYFTDKVFFHSWNDNFSEMRNKVISYCTGEWVMVIDGDEILENSAEIIKFFNSKDSKKFNSALLMVKNLTDEKDLSSFSMLSSPRLFRKDKDFRYEGAVHNQPIFKAPTVKLDCSLIHYGYISTDKELMERKFIRTVSLLKNELEKEPLNFYYWCQLSVSYSMHNEYEKAMESSIKAYEVLKNNGGNPSKHIYVYMQLAYSYLMNKEYKKAIEICSEGIDLKSGVLDLHFYLAKAQMMTREYKSAIKNYKEYLNIAENIRKFTDTNVSLYTLGRYEYAYYDLVIALKEIEDYESAFVYCKKITDEKLIGLNLNNFIYLCFKLKDYEYLYEYYTKVIVKTSNEDNFEEIVELYQKDISDTEKLKIADLLKNVDTIYGVLSKVRYSMFTNKKLDIDINSYLNVNVNLNNLSDYYGDFIYYLVLNTVDVSDTLKFVRELDFNRFFVYLNDKYQEFGQNILFYLRKNNFSQELHSLRIKKSLERYAVILCDLDESEFSGLFNQYVNDGMLYINSIYSKEIILNENIYELKNEEEAFFVYMIKADLVKASDKRAYIGFLRKALAVYPYMRRGIEFLLNGFNNDMNLINSELEQYKVQVKNTIKSLIENNRLEDAKAVISEYEQIIKDDVEIVLFKSQIALKRIEGQSQNNIEQYKM